MKQRTCSRCGKTKPLADYYRNARCRDGRMPWCKSCHAARVARNRADRIARDYGRFRSIARAADHRYRKANPIKLAARAALNRAVREGLVEREGCIFCGEPDAHGHHWDYARPLDVVWVCPYHHGLVHRQVDEP